MFIINLPLLQAKLSLACKVYVLFKAGLDIVAFFAVSACLLAS